MDNNRSEGIPQLGGYYSLVLALRRHQKTIMEEKEKAREATLETSFLIFDESPKGQPKSIENVGKIST